jgi:hypothetical protein
MVNVSGSMEVDSLVEFKRLDITEILDQDSRPTFVIDLDPDEDAPNGSNTILPIYSNSALRLHERLSDAIVGKDILQIPTDKSESTFNEFRSWATSTTPHDDSKDVYPLSCLYAHMLWTGSTIRRRWRLISGNLLWHATAPINNLSSGAPIGISTGGLRVEQATKVSPVGLEITRNNKQFEKTEEESMQTDRSAISSFREPQSSKTSFPQNTLGGGSSRGTGDSGHSKTSIVLAAPEKAVSDWTVIEPKGILTPHLKFARTVDWASTPLGPMEKWSPEF